MFPSFLNCYSIFFIFFYLDTVVWFIHKNCKKLFFYWDLLVTVYFKKCKFFKEYLSISFIRFTGYYSFYGIFWGQIRIRKKVFDPDPQHWTQVKIHAAAAVVTRKRLTMFSESQMGSRWLWSPGSSSRCSPPLPSSSRTPSQSDRYSGDSLEK